MSDPTVRCPNPEPHEPHQYAVRPGGITFAGGLCDPAQWPARTDAKCLYCGRGTDNTTDRVCPKCGRKSALKHHSDDLMYGSYCRWTDCGYERFTNEGLTRNA